jgi:hypothetical protein
MTYQNFQRKYSALAYYDIENIFHHWNNKKLKNYRIIIISIGTYYRKYSIFIKIIFGIVVFTSSFTVLKESPLILYNTAPPLHAHTDQISKRSLQTDERGIGVVGTRTSDKSINSDHCIHVYRYLFRALSRLIAIRTDQPKWLARLFRVSFTSSTPLWRARPSIAPVCHHAAVSRTTIEIIIIIIIIYVKIAHESPTPNLRRRPAASVSRSYAMSMTRLERRKRRVDAMLVPPGPLPLPITVGATGKKKLLENLTIIIKL